MTPDYTASNRIRFDEDRYGERQPWTVHSRGLEYKGEVVVTEETDSWLGRRLESGLNFRIVFFTVPRRIPTNRIRDPRIAMAVPLRAPEQTSRTLNREIKGVRETSVRYRTSADPDLRALSTPMGRREESLQSELGTAYMMPFSRGRVYTQSGFTIAPGDVYVEGRPESWADHLAGAILAQAVPELPIDPSGFPGTLTEDSISALYRGLFQGDEESADAVTDFAPGLGLALNESPTLFDASGCRVLSIIQETLDSGVGEMPALDMLDVLISSNGLPRLLAALYLIAFVYQNRAEIELVQGHKVERYGDGPFLGGSITRDLVPALSFDEMLIDRLGTLRSRPKLSWNTVLPYAALVAEGLEPADSESTAEQERRLLDALNAITSGMPHRRARLRALEDGLGANVPQDAMRVLDSLDEFSAVSGYLEFYSIAQRFNGVNGLGQALEAYRRLSHLAGLSPDILAAKTYLDGMKFGRHHQDFEFERDAFLGRFNLNNLLSQPSLWDGLAAEIALFETRYANVYVPHHTRYHQEALELRNRLERIAPQVDALGWFNDMSELGEPVGEEVQQLYKDVSSSTKSCLVRDDALSLEDAPYCQNCLLALDEDVPRFEAETVFGAAESAMRVYNRRLGAYTAHRVLARPDGEQLDKFTNLIQIADPSSLVNVLDAEVIEFLRQFLKDGS